MTNCNTGCENLYASFFTGDPASNTNASFGKVYTGALTAASE
jgi:hypothetical protein